MREEWFNLYTSSIGLGGRGFKERTDIQIVKRYIKHTQITPRAVNETQKIREPVGAEKFLPTFLSD